MITDLFLIRALFKLQEKSQVCRKYGKKSIKMTDMLKETESKVVDNIVKKTTTKVKPTKQSKIKIKTKKTVKEAKFPNKKTTKTKPTK